MVWEPTRRREIRSREQNRKHDYLQNFSKAGPALNCVQHSSCLDLLRWMLIFIFRFWKPELLRSPGGREVESIWSQCTVSPLFSLPFPPWQLVRWARLTIGTVFQYISMDCNLHCSFFLEPRLATFAGSLAAVIAQNDPFFMSPWSTGTQVQSHGSMDRRLKTVTALTHCALHTG